MNDKRFGNNVTAKEITTQIKPVIISPEETIDPMAFLSFFPE